MEFNPARIIISYSHKNNALSLLRNLITDGFQYSRLNKRISELFDNISYHFQRFPIIV